MKGAGCFALAPPLEFSPVAESRQAQPTDHVHCWHEYRSSFSETVVLTPGRRRVCCHCGYRQYQRAYLQPAKGHGTHVPSAEMETIFAWTNMPPSESE